MTATTIPERFTTIAGDVTFPRVVRSEWTKFRSLRSTWWALTGTVMISLGLGFASSLDAANGSPGQPVADLSAHDVAVASQFGLLIAQLAAVTLGALFISSEHGTGMIHATMTVVPRRSTVLLSKATVLVGVIFPVMAVTSVSSLLLGNVALHAQGGVDEASLGDDGVLSVVLGTPLYLSAAATFAMAIGTIVRNTAAAVSTLTAIFFILPVITLSASPLRPVSKFLPSNAGSALSGQGISFDPLLSGWTGFALFCVYTATTGVVAAGRLRRSDV